jgi:uncharacterized protein YndB with AHSA1/START domain
MSEIIATQLEIAAAPAIVARALATTEGHRAWWVSTAQVGAAPGERASVRFDRKDGSQTAATFRIDRQDEHGIEWTCVAHEGMPDWNGTRLAIRIAESGGGTHVELLHAGFPERNKVYEMCIGGWQYFMQSLKAYAETGRGTPHAA